MTIELAGRQFPEVDLLPGESIKAVWQADGFYLGSNPLAKAIAALQSFLVTITGGHIRVFLALTNMRVLLVQSTAQWCGCTRIRGVHTIASSSIKEAGIAKETQWCCIHSRAIHIESLTQRHTLIVKKFNDEDLKGFLSQLSRHIIENTRTT